MAEQNYIIKDKVLHVSGCPRSTTHKDLEDIFAPYGIVMYTKLVSKGNVFFVAFMTPEEVELVLKSRPYSIRGTRLTVVKANKGMQENFDKRALGFSPKVVFVSNFPSDTEGDEIQDTFKQQGHTPLEVKIIDHSHVPKKNYGFVTLSSAAEVVDALKKTFILRDSVLIVRYSFSSVNSNKPLREGQHMKQNDLKILLSGVPRNCEPKEIEEQCNEQFGDVAWVTLVPKSLIPWQQICAKVVFNSKRTVEKASNIGKVKLGDSYAVVHRISRESYDKNDDILGGLTLRDNASLPTSFLADIICLATVKVLMVSAEHQLYEQLSNGFFFYRKGLLVLPSDIFDKFERHPEQKYHMILFLASTKQETHLKINKNGESTGETWKGKLLIRNPYVNIALYQLNPNREAVPNVFLAAGARPLKNRSIFSTDWGASSQVPGVFKRRIDDVNVPFDYDQSESGKPSEDIIQQLNTILGADEKNNACVIEGDSLRTSWNSRGGVAVNEWGNVVGMTYVDRYKFDKAENMYHFNKTRKGKVICTYPRGRIIPINWIWYVLQEMLDVEENPDKGSIRSLFFLYRKKVL